VIGPRVHTVAWSVLALGIACRLVPWLERNATRSRRWLIGSLPVLLGAVPVVAGMLFLGNWLKEKAEARRPLPPSGSPNVLLIVFDTVRADHLSLYGYNRPTSPALDRLAKRGIRFDEARATAPWTLPSHASLFTGRWPHEFTVKWMSPLSLNFPTLAEYLGTHGYATAGFVGNTLYCSYDTGLNRGFAHYEDYLVELERFRLFRAALLVDRACAEISVWGLLLNRSLDLGPFRPWLEALLRPMLATGRKDARSINRGFLDWLSHRREPRRPFFAFLNYFDAHSPYIPPENSTFRFGSAPLSEADFLLLNERWSAVDKLRLAPRYRLLVRDSYDNCISYLDERLGELFEELERRSVLDETLVIVTADHGEELGDHALFDHGESLYRPEIRVPLLIVLPSPSQFRGVVSETVSLRDLPRTIVELAKPAFESPFPGQSLAGLWRDPRPRAASGADDREGAISELSEPNPSVPSQGRSPASRGALVSLAEGNFVYIRNEGDRTEQLFNQRDDPRELVNQAGVEAMKPVLNRLRQNLSRMIAGAEKGVRNRK
jgi:arylsulfatase A-like enzyme